MNAPSELEVALLDAAGVDDAAAVEKLITDHQVDPNARTNPQWGGYPALVVAAREGHVSAVGALLRGGARPSAASSKSRSTALHMAAARGYVDVMQLLLESGADLEAVDRSQCTPLHVAAGAQGVRGLGVLLDAGAQLEARKNNGATPLQVAAYEGNAEAVRLLLERGADWTSANRAGRVPRDYAELRGHDAVLAVLDAWARRESMLQVVLGLEGGQGSLSRMAQSSMFERNVFLLVRELL